MKNEKKKWGWDLEMKSMEDLNKMFKIEKGKIVAWYCFESKEWVDDGFECQCGTALEVSEFQKI
jgi:hypothetical protein